MRSPILAMRGHPSFWHGTARNGRLPANKMREAERRQAHTHYNRATPNKRYRLSALRARRAPRSCGVAAAMRFGRARLSALRRGTRQALRLAQLRAAFVSIWRSLCYSKRLLASSSRPSRSAGEAGSEAARERSVWLRPQGPRSLCLTGAPSRQASLKSETAPPSSGRADGVKPNHC
jgi:hypothetical protein